MHRSRSILALAILVSLVGGAATAGMKGKDRRATERIESASDIVAARPWVLYPDRDDRSRVHADVTRNLREDGLPIAQMTSDQARPGG